MTPEIRIQPEDFEPGAEIARLEGLGGGAVATFTGLVRGEGGIRTMGLEHYPGMTEKALGGIADQAAARWALAGVTIIHRVGRLGPGARIVFVGTASHHRRDAIEAMHFIIDWLKTDAPFWKREEFADGRSEWVAARAADDAARDRWSG
ncbi:molybdenum cofactor biosynthesis protein MoaE [Parasphingopyxis marina]|uniref:Molybdopterin synthase catalytic subunit n=1 Tax=Parasphingopyxis marina TaxID=2761622 RepID=A0A842HY81_9SPHN|nr:molybdenum cofactor biosynthesis protein MoaE [Parasphingopyxis marina]MBC2777289.1 molybdenum cofactor biosynthesis protein MoaE [Parasphingopyxis marina]